MKNEAQFKTAFKKSVKAAKGFSISLAAPMLAGIPDLYVIVPGYMPVLLEAKWLGEITAHNFNRKIPYSKLQKLWLRSACDIQEYAAMGVVGFKFKDEIYCILVEDSVENINYGFRRYQPWVVYKDKQFDIQALFHQTHIPMTHLTFPRTRANDSGDIKTAIGAINDA